MSAALPLLLLALGCTGDAPDDIYDDTYPAGPTMQASTLTVCSDPTTGVGVYDTVRVTGPGTFWIDVVEGAAWDPMLLELAALDDLESAPTYKPEWDDATDCTVPAPNGGGCPAVTLSRETTRDFVITAKPGGCSEPGEASYTMYFDGQGEITPTHSTVTMTDLWITAMCGEWYEDSDQDGWGSEQRATCWTDGLVQRSGDCDDGAAAIHPDATEACNGIDDDCDSRLDNYTNVYLDADGDGFGNPDTVDSVCGAVPDGWITAGNDCADDDTSRHPGAEELCNGIDDDCDGNLHPQRHTAHFDADGDGHGLADVTQVVCDEDHAGWAHGGDDCDDDNPARNPSQPELCNDQDDDCDDEIDESALDATTWYMDADGDGHGVSPSVSTGCYGTGNWSTNADDCDDGDYSNHPGGFDGCLAGDHDCSGTADETQNDSREPNDDMATAPLVAGNADTFTWTGFVPGGDVDAYAMYAPDDTDFANVFFTDAFEVNIHLIDPTGPVTLTVYKDGNQVWSGTRDASTYLRWEGTYGADDTGTWTAVVHNASGCSNAQYTLTMSNFY